MRFVDSRCIHCGATLRVAHDATHVCCQYCNTELLIERDGDRVSTLLLREVHEDLGQKLDVLRVQNELERLDREWHLGREQFMVNEKGGGRSVPTIAGSLLMGLLAVGFGIFWTVFASGFAPWPFTLFGVLFVGFAIFIAANGANKASAHGSAEQDYLAQRRLLLSDLNHVERSGAVVKK